ncbi:hypothetical protein ACFO25_20435 [Paenactinomyces guangxiensis]|uniref:Uncharacterized protein n=1 Tax=Paenactinomyces guangxiensis TaxID=1490290 RepID=A0A7W1WU36_9BACL|nr:hypothetical protein [Paenactinomyces guangxiensis]MBA4496103.1 hypothetical protein [Paenactinomyces guangxiensis]MBH8593191.1 hypothetical protein [Paenactinomyces guangxiensis]
MKKKGEHGMDQQTVTLVINGKRIKLTPKQVELLTRGEMKQTELGVQDL